MTIKSILVPTDGSDNGKIALEYGIYVAKRFDALLTGLHVLDIRLMQEPVYTGILGSNGLPPYQEFIPVLQNGFDKKAQSILDAFKMRCEESGLRPELKKVIGVVDEAIIEESQSVDCIILSQRGRRLHIADGILGSTAESVVRKSGKPVMVTPSTFMEIESMGLAYDGSEPADKALKLAVEISDHASWPLTVIIITDDHELGAQLTKSIDDYLEPFKIDCEIIILKGKEDEEILKFTEEGSIELMVMGAYGHNRLRELLLGSTTSHIIRNSKIPVLLTR